MPHIDTRTAARPTESDASRLRDQVVQALATVTDGLTADECAKKIGQSALAVRPRMSELKNDGKIVDSGIRRLNASGKRAAVMRLAA